MSEERKAFSSEEFNPREMGFRVGETINNLPSHINPKTNDPCTQGSGTIQNQGDILVDGQVAYVSCSDCGDTLRVEL